MMTQLGKYELHEQLGRGGFGTVYRAIDTSLNREVALKVLHPQLTTDPDFLERFRNEARLVAALDSPYIVTIFDLGEADGRVFIAMKYLPGGSLKQKLENEGAILFDQSLKIIKQVCDGLAVAHKKGLVHRDIKPGNILFDADGNAVLGDFGLARAVQQSSLSATSSTGGVGTPSYRAPELWTGEIPASAATDIYSVGCVFSEMLSGKTLFEGDTTEKILTRHLITGPLFPDSYPEGVPVGVCSVIQKAVTKESKERYQSIAEFKKGLSDLENNKLEQNVIEGVTGDTHSEPPVRARSHFSKSLNIDQKEKLVEKKPISIPPYYFGILGGSGIILLIIIGLLSGWFKPKFTPLSFANISNKTPTIETLSGDSESAGANQNSTNIQTEENSIDPNIICSSDEYGCAVFKKGDVIKIGMGAPMNGGNAIYGIDISRGASIAIADVGDIYGWPLTLDAQDDEGTVEGGNAVANKFVADPAVVAVAGHIFSGPTAAVIPIYEKAGIPMLSPSATNLALTTTGSKVFNRIAFTDLNQGNNAADYLYNTLGAKKLAVLHDGSDYGKGLAEIVAAQFVKDGGEIAYELAITPGWPDYSAQLFTIASTSPDAIFFGGFIAEGAVLVNQMKATGLENTTFFGCDGIYGKDFLTRTGVNGEGTYSAIAPASPVSIAKDTFNAAFLNQFGVEAGYTSPYTWAGYDSVAALATAIKQAAFVSGDTLYIPRGALVTAVRTLTDYVGLSGTFTCQSNGECNTDKPQFVVVKDGQWVNVY